MSSLPAGYDAVPLDAWTPTTVVDSDIVFSGVVLLFAALALVFVLYHYLTVSRRGQRDAAGTPPSGGRRQHGRVVGADAAASIVQGVRPVVPRPLPVTLYRARDFEEALECAVCLADLCDGEAARFLPKCGHGFHAECVGLWLRSHPTCPLCRVDVDTLAPLVLSPVPPEPAHYPTNLPTNVLFWGSQYEVATTTRIADAVGRPSSSSDAVAAELAIDVPPETTPPPAMAPREGDAAKSRGLERLRSMWTRGRKHEVAASSTRSCGRATATASA